LGVGPAQICGMWQMYRHLTYGLTPHIRGGILPRYCINYNYDKDTIHNRRSKRFQVKLVFPLE
ncbi:MAG: hypothetical protein ABWJ97_00110, partial [Thermoproteus sp.]